MHMSKGAVFRTYIERNWQFDFKKMEIFFVRTCQDYLDNKYLGIVIVFLIKSIFWIVNHDLE